MSLEIRMTTAFERDLRRVRKQGRDLDKLETLVDLLQNRQPVPPRNHRHPLRGQWSGHWDCHIAPDWLLLYRETERALILVRTGSHAELFE